MGCQNCIKDTSIGNGPRFFVRLGHKTSYASIESNFLRNSVITIQNNNTERPRDMQHLGVWTLKIHSFKLDPKALEIYTDIFNSFIKNLENLKNLKDFTRIWRGVFGFLPPLWYMMHNFRDTRFFLEPKPRYSRPDCKVHVF